MPEGGRPFMIWGTNGEDAPELPPRPEAPAGKALRHEKDAARIAYRRHIESHGAASPAWIQAAMREFEETWEPKIIREWRERCRLASATWTTIHTASARPAGDPTQSPLRELMPDEIAARATDWPRPAPQREAPPQPAPRPAWDEDWRNGDYTIKEWRGTL